MASVVVSLDNMIQNNEGNGLRGGRRGRGLRAPGGEFRGARKLDGHPCRGPLGMRGVRGPGGRFSGARKLDGHPCRGPLGLRGVRGRRGTLEGARQLDGHPCRGPLGMRGVRGSGGRFRAARRLDGHLCGGPTGLRCVRGPGGTFRGARGLDGPPHQGPLGIYAITKTMRGTRNLPWQNHVSEDRFRAVGSSGVESGTKLQVSNLNAGVSNEDIRALFSEIGELIRYGIHYDKDGNPCGSAEVVFARSSDAFQAIKRHNNTDLDGKPMKIEKVGSIVRAHVASRLNMIGGENGRRTARLMPGSVYMRGASILDNGAGSSSQMARGGWNGDVPIRRRGGCGRGGGTGGFRGRVVEKSAEELDKELENYQAETRQTQSE